MGNPITVPEAFHYDGIDGTSKSQLIKLAGYIKKETAAGFHSMLEMGASLSEAHDLLANNGDGNFGKWVEAECWISRTSAFRYINAHKRLGKDCSSLEQTLTLEAVYALTAPNAPPAALQEAKKLAKRGVVITAKVAHSLIKPKHEEAKEEDEPIADEILPPAIALDLDELEATPRQREMLAEYDEDSQAALIESVRAGRQTLAQAIETGEVPEPTADEIMAEVNRKIESFCRQLVSQFVSECPDDHWLDDLGRKKLALAKLKECCESLRSGKCRCLCPKCNGDGCCECHDTGRITSLKYQQIV